MSEYKFGNQRQSNGRPVISYSDENEENRDHSPSTPAATNDLSQLQAPTPSNLTQQITVAQVSNSQSNSPSTGQNNLNEQEKINFLRQKMLEASGDKPSQQLPDLDKLRHLPKFRGQLSEWQTLHKRADDLVEVGQNDKKTGAKVAIAGAVVEGGAMVSWLVAAANVMRNTPGVYGKLAAVGLATVSRGIVGALGENVRASGANLADQGQQTEQQAMNALIDIGNHEYQLLSFHATRGEVQMQLDQRRSAVSRRVEPFRQFAPPLTAALDARGMDTALTTIEESKRANVIARNLGEVGDFAYRLFRRKRDEP
ncbi:MAG: hypothetical protein PHC51_00335 [bacterium]|nr:hypothetical protein [bacterium]